MKARACCICCLPLVLAVCVTGCMTKALWAQKSYRPASVTALKFAPASTNIVVLYQEECISNTYKYRSGPKTLRLCLLTDLTRPDSRPNFLPPTNTDDWISIPVANLNFETSPPPYREVFFRLDRVITNRADAEWALGNNLYSSTHKSYVTLGTNAAGQALYITNAPPLHGYYMVLPKPHLPWFSRRYLTTSEPPPANGYYAVTLSDHLTLWQDGREEGTYVLPTYGTYVHSAWYRLPLSPVAGIGDGVGLYLLYLISFGGMFPTAELH